MANPIDWQAGGRSFNQVAEIYDVYRPGYPEELVETAVIRSGIPAGGKILEIGSGTGKATLPFARRGYAIVCVEPGEDLAGVARRNLGEYPKIRWEIAAFQDWQAGAEEFDLVMSAQAFHWVPEPEGYARAASLLKAGGCLALIWNMQGQHTDPVFADLDRVYRERAPELDDGKSSEEVILQREQDIRQCAYFYGLEVYRFPWTRRYDTHQYLGLLNTFSDHLRMDEARRASLFEGVAEVLDRHGGALIKPYQAVLYLARVKK